MASRTEEQAAAKESTEDESLPAPANAALKGGWKRFYDGHFDLVWRLLARFGAPEHELEDLVQEVFIIVHRKLPTFRGDAQVKTWLFTICRRVAARNRRRFRFRHGALSLWRKGLGIHSTQPAPVDARRDLARLLDQLSETKRITLLLKEADGMSAREIAEVFDCPEATVWSRLRLAMQDLTRIAQQQAGAARPEGGSNGR